MREQMHQRVKDAQDQITQALSAIDGQDFEETHWGASRRRRRANPCARERRCVREGRREHIGRTWGAARGGGGQYARQGNRQR